MSTWRAKLLPGFVVHDGDTLTRCTLDIGWHIRLADQSIRLTSTSGPVNAPELTGPEAEVGRLVRDVLDKWLAGQEEIWIESQSISRDAYGRTIGVVLIGHGDDATDIGKTMLLREIAKECGPDGKRIPWTPSELAIARESATRILEER